MTNKFNFLLLIIFCSAALGLAQTKPQPDSTPPAVQESNEVIMISSKLVLVDALVLDNDGKQVSDLTADDFEVFQDGKPQEITNFSYIGSEKNGLAPGPSGKKSIPLPPVSVRSNQGRVITFVIDDGNCLATPEGLEVARDGVKKFIDRQMLPNDRVAIYRTRGGSSLLQIYTSNKEMLKRTVNKVSWVPSGCGSAFEAARNNETAKIITGQGNRTFESETDKEFKADVADFERNNQAKGSFGVLGFVIDRLKTLPQRKIVFFISEGIPIGPRDSTIHDGLREIADKASRSSVVFYTMSEKGLAVPGMVEARDDVSGDNVSSLVEARRDEERSLNNGLAYLADQTGGKFIFNKSFLDPEIGRVLEAEQGYYLIGYRPSGETFQGKDFHKIEVKLKRPDLSISSRRGFFGREEKESRPKYKNAESPLYQAIASPFQESDMDIRLTALTGNDPAQGNFIRAIFHVNGSDLSFTEESGGMKRVVLDVVAVILDEKGKVIEEFNRTYPIRIPERGVETVRQNGLDYSTDIPIKKPGFYSFRIAVRDEKTRRLGSAGDYLEITDLKKDRFFIAGLLTTDLSSDGKPDIPKPRSVDFGFAPVFSMSVPSIRRYKAGQPFAYIYKIYNAGLDKGTGKHGLMTKFRLYKDGKLLLESAEKPIELGDQADSSRIQDYGPLRLNESAQPGEYILQLIITDSIKKQVSTQWIDFEIIG